MAGYVQLDLSPAIVFGGFHSRVEPEALTFVAARALQTLE